MNEPAPLHPKNTFELLRWLVFEPDFLEEFSNTVTGWQNRARAMFYPTVCITAGSLLIFLLVLSLISGLNLPYWLPDQFQQQVTESWKSDFLTDTWLLFDLTIMQFFIGLAVGLAFGWIVGIVVGLGSGLVVSLAYGLAGGLAVGLSVSLAVGVIGGIVFGLAFGLAGGLAFGLVGGLARSLAFGLTVGALVCAAGVWVGGWRIGLIFGFAFFVSDMFFYSRSYIYFWHVAQNVFVTYSFGRNPHLWDAGIYFPLPGLENECKQEAWENPPAGLSFANFLFKRRKWQRRLAWQILLASVAGYWRQERCISTALKRFPTIDKTAVWLKDEDPFFFGIKISLSRAVIHRPSGDWYPQLETTRKTLSDFEQESNVQLRVDYFRTFREELDKLYDLALRQPPEWNDYFVKALDLWKKSAAEKLRDLEEEAAAEEPIAANIYRGGEKLKPEDKALFLGRADLRDAFKKRVVTAVQMPLFFVQGQRRVGKSSLIAFLPTFLDRGFTVVALDMQEYPGLSLPALLQKLRERIYTAALGQNAPELAFPDHWLDAWQLFRDDLENLMQSREGKIVLAIDEYEELHKILQTDPAQGGALLGAMRSWSQSQNRVVFLFAGADFFSELKNPNWAEYFVQAERLYVDYLDREDTFKLINLVGLKYPPELLERMYRETAGHPCLLQKICREIVTIANKEGRENRAIVEADYEEALRRVLLVPDDGVVNVFWQQFCENRGLKDAVRQILRGEIPGDEKALLVLEDHRFILRDTDGVRLRVPLFERWLGRYQVT